MDLILIVLFVTVYHSGLSYGKLCGENGGTITFIRTSKTTSVQNSPSTLAGAPLEIDDNVSTVQQCATKCRKLILEAENGNVVKNTAATPVKSCGFFIYTSEVRTCAYFAGSISSLSGKGQNDTSPPSSPTSTALRTEFLFEPVCIPMTTTRDACIHRPYAFERVHFVKLEGFSGRSVVVANRDECLAICLIEKTFVCRSVNYNQATKRCDLNREDQRSKPQFMRQGGDPSTLTPTPDLEEYYDNNCLNRQNRCGQNPGNLVFIKTTHFQMKNFDATITIAPAASNESFCLQRCLDSKEVYCRSIEYNKDTRRCVISDEDTFSRASAQTTLPGSERTHYYEPVCVSSDLSSSTCRQEAAFERQIGKRLVPPTGLSPVVTAKAVTVPDCISLCFQNIDCRSINYNRSAQACDIFSVKVSVNVDGGLKEDEGGQLETDASVDHYEYNCESQFGGVVLCTDEGIKFVLNTKEPYTGAIYAAERYSQCRKEVVNARQINILFPPPTIDTKCGTVLRNGRLEVDVVVSLDGVLPHQVTTEWDRFYRISCDTTLQGQGEGSVIITTMFGTEWVFLITVYLF